MAKKKQPGFEELLAATEEIVDTLDSGEMGLEKSLELYETGVNNLRRLNQQLTAAEEKVKQLAENSAGELELSDFHVEEDGLYGSEDEEE